MLRTRPRESRLAPMLFMAESLHWPVHYRRHRRRRSTAPLAAGCVAAYAPEPVGGTLGSGSSDASTQFNGTVKLEYRPEGLACTICAPVQ